MKISVDTKEAREIFETVLPPSEYENAVAELLPDRILYPTGGADVFDVNRILESIVDPGENETTAEAQQDEPDGRVSGVGDRERDCGEEAS